MLYTIRHKIGTGAGSSAQGTGGGVGGTAEKPAATAMQQLPLMLKDDLYSYARTAFGYELLQHRQLLSSTAEEKV